MTYLHQTHGLSIRQACIALIFHRSLYYYQPVRKTDDLPIIEALTQLADQYPTYGFWKFYQILRKNGAEWNHKRVYRVYKKLKMNIKRKAKRRLPPRLKQPLYVPERPNQIWSMDFMSDRLYSGRKLRILNLIDDFNREALIMEVDTSLGATRMVELLDQLINDGSKPEQIRVDNGPEFISNTFVSWCNHHRIEIRYIQPGKPVQNAFIERFNGSYRRAILDAYIFQSIRQVKMLTQQWMYHYNHQRPHDALDGKTPYEFVENIKQMD